LDWLVLGGGVTQIRNNPIRVAMPKEIKAVFKPMLSILLTHIFLFEGGAGSRHGEGADLHERGGHQHSRHPKFLAGFLPQLKRAMFRRPMLNTAIFAEKRNKISLFLMF